MEAQFKKGILEYCLLYRISQRETYGYDLLQTAAEAFPDVQESTVYAILRRLNGNGCTETYEGSKSGGPVRKYYRVTSAGAVMLEKMDQDWRELLTGVNKMKEFQK